eukprot:1689437-Pyramimonas_sp.AAC.1
MSLDQRHSGETGFWSRARSVSCRNAFIRELPSRVPDDALLVLEKRGSQQLPANVSISTYWLHHQSWGPEDDGRGVQLTRASCFIHTCANFLRLHALCCKGGKGG